MNFCLTTSGKEYIAKVNAGKMQMHLTRVVTGSGNSSSLEILTGVIDEMQQIQLDEVMAQGEYTYITCVLTNLELEREYVLRQIGLYAVDDMGIETLIIIGQDKYGDRIPVLTEKEVEYQYNIGMRVSNAAEVTFDFSVNDFLRKKYFYEHLEEFEKYKNVIQDQFKALPKVKVGSAEQLDRKDTILMELLKDTDKIYRILEMDSEDQRHEYELAAVFKTAKKREQIQSEETMSVLFGKIQKWFEDMKVNCFREADNPFVLMTLATYKAPSLRTPGSLYGLVTKQRGLIIIFFNRFVHGTENPKIENTIYGTNSTEQSEGIKAENSYKAIISNIVYLEDGKDIERKPYAFYVRITKIK